VSGRGKWGRGGGEWDLGLGGHDAERDGVGPPKPPLLPFTSANSSYPLSSSPTPPGYLAHLAAFRGKLMLDMPDSGSESSRGSGGDRPRPLLTIQVR
jgi:hypothetical protein